MTSSKSELRKIALCSADCSADFQTRLGRRFTPGRFWGIGYTTGLETCAPSAPAEQAKCPAGLLHNPSPTFLRCVSVCSRHAAIANTAVRPSQGSRSKNVMIIVALS